MKNLFKSLALVAVLAVSSTGAFADQYTYSEGTWAVAARAGIAPATFNKDANLTATFTVPGAVVPAGNGNVNNVGGVFRTNVSKSHNQLYSVPFFVGADVGYFVCDNWEVFVNFDFDHACSKKNTFIENLNNNPAPIDWKVRDHSGYAGYIGSRWYFCGFDCIVPFVGAKLGIKGSSSCSGSESLTLRAEDLGLGTKVYPRTTHKDCSSFAGGLQLGFDWFFADSYALTFMSEMIGVSGRKFDSSINIHEDGSDANRPFVFLSQMTKNPRGYLSFPLTIGVRVRM